MKILKWRIYRSSKIEKIVQLLQGTADDILIAKELLTHPAPTEDNIYPKYRFWITSTEIQIQSKLESRSGWIRRDYSYYSGIVDKENVIKRLKIDVEKLKISDLKQIERNQFKEYSINL